MDWFLSLTLTYHGVALQSYSWKMETQHILWGVPINIYHGMKGSTTLPCLKMFSH